MKLKKLKTGFAAIFILSALIFAACSNSSGGGSDDTSSGDGTTGTTVVEETTVVAKDFSLSKISHEITSAVQVVKTEALAKIKEGDVLEITITPASWNTTDGGQNTWYCYACGNSGDGDYLGDIDDWAADNSGVVSKTITVTSEMAEKLKAGGLWIYGNNKDAKVTVICKSKTVTTTNGETTNNGTTNNDSGNNTTTGGNTSTGGNGGNTTVVKTDFVKGFDASMVDFYENKLNYTWKDTDGTAADFFEILARHGINTIRLRLWVDPTNAMANGIITADTDFNANTDKNGGDNTLARTIRMAKRAKAKNFDVMLDFHYSDYWTDPGKQIIPKSWQSITTPEAMENKISEYTKDVLNQMKDAGCLPEYVQVGNEINSGILLHSKYTSGDYGTAPTGTLASLVGTASSEPNSNFAKYLVAGCKAVKEIDSNIKVILHVTNRQASYVNTIAGAMTGNESYYDIIGLSYYPWISDHGSISDLKSRITAIKAKGKAAMVVETSMYWEQDTGAAVVANLGNVYSHMSYSDLTTKTVNGTNTIEGTVSNQYNVFKHIIEEVKDSGGIGVCAWGGEKRGDWQYGFFEGGGKALSSIGVFKNEGIGDTTTSGGSGSTATPISPPTWVGIGGKFTSDTWENYKAMTESSSGIWTLDIENMQAKPGEIGLKVYIEEDKFYGSGSALTLGTPANITEGGGNSWFTAEAGSTYTFTADFNTTPATLKVVKKE